MSYLGQSGQNVYPKSNREAPSGPIDKLELRDILLNNLACNRQKYQGYKCQRQTKQLNTVPGLEFTFKKISLIK